MAASLAGLGIVDLITVAPAGMAWCLATLALAGLGPGAYSVDARLFGRRILRIKGPGGPSRPHPDE